MFPGNSHPCLPHLTSPTISITCQSVNLQFITSDETYFVTSLSPRVHSFIRFYFLVLAQCKITWIHWCSCPMELFHRSESPLCSAYSFFLPSPTSSLGFDGFYIFLRDLMPFIIFPRAYGHLSFSEGRYRPSCTNCQLYVLYDDRSSVSSSACVHR